MNERLNGKVALVTGASSGIGEAAAKALAAQGASVVLAARRTDELDRVAKEIESAGGNVVSVRTDVTVDEDIANAVRTAEDQFGGLDIAFNNAGSMGQMGLVADQNPLAWTTDLSNVLTTAARNMNDQRIQWRQPALPTAEMEPLHEARHEMRAFQVQNLWSRQPGRFEDPRIADLFRSVFCPVCHDEVNRGVDVIIGELVLTRHRDRRSRQEGLGNSVRNHTVPEPANHPPARRDHSRQYRVKAGKVT